uniref:Uncharacterized protein n=1 Tax=Anguilla anguilla TaxID=7936 RepID=A0A0E9R6R9_ANGAN
MMFTSCMSHWQVVRIFKQSICKSRRRGYSSVVEHLTADQEVLGSNPGAPSGLAADHFKFCILVLTVDQP